MQLCNLFFSFHLVSSTILWFTNSGYYVCCTCQACIVLGPISHETTLVEWEILMLMGIAIITRPRPFSNHCLNIHYHLDFDWKHLHLHIHGLGILCCPSLIPWYLSVYSDGLDSSAFTSENASDHCLPGYFCPSSIPIHRYLLVCFLVCARWPQGLLPCLKSRCWFAMALLLWIQCVCHLILSGWTLESCPWGPHHPCPQLNHFCCRAGGGGSLVQVLNNSLSNWIAFFHRLWRNAFCHKNEAFCNVDLNRLIIFHYFMEKFYFTVAQRGGRKTSYNSSIMD